MRKSIKKNYKKFGFVCDMKPILSVIDDEFDIETGFTMDASIYEKLKFYQSAQKFSKFLKKLFTDSGSNVYVGKSYTDSVFMHWSNLENYDSYVNLKSIFNQKYDYKLNIQNDEKIIDYIIENDFRYFSQINFYLEKYNLLIEPNCHMCLHLYSDRVDMLYNSISDLCACSGLKLEN